MRAQARYVLRILKPSLPTVRPKTPPDGKLREAIQSRAGRPDCFTAVLLAVTETRASSSSVASSFETPRNGVAPQDEVLDLMVRSAATPRVSNHEARGYA